MNEENINDYKTQPFGDPDGGRNDLKDIMAHFITFHDEYTLEGLALNEDNRKARILVGRKGSGKTVQLRRLHASAKKENSIFVDSIENVTPTTSQIIKFCQWYDEPTLTEAWKSIWRAAFFQVIISHLFTNESLKNNIDEADIKYIMSTYKEILPPLVRKPYSVYSRIGAIIDYHKSANHINIFLNHELWQPLKKEITSLLETSKPLFFYLDAIDDEFAHAPMYWLRCQKGLFYQVMNLMKEEFGSSLHIVICIRDMVYSHVLQGEHSTRYFGDSHIKLLKWDKEAIEYFLKQKIEQLDNTFFIGNFENGKNLYSWLGLEKLNNGSTVHKRKISEPILQYILRHTRLLPRDIIILGNMLCQKIKRNKSSIITKKARESLLIETIKEASIRFADEQLTICANHISSNEIPQNAGIQNYSEFYTGNDEHIRSIKENLIEVIQHIGKDRFTFNELLKAKEYSKQLFENETCLFSILWENNLVGYVEHSIKYEVFYFDNYSVEFNIPENKKEYTFHSILIDKTGIKPIGKPVIPFKH